MQNRGSYPHCQNSCLLFPHLGRLGGGDNYSDSGGGRGTLKQPVFGIFERNGRVYTEIVPDCKKTTLQQVILGKVALESVIYSDGWRGYNGLVDVGYSKHFRVNHGANEFARGQCHINGIESFWSFCKRRLAKFNGISKEYFDYHLKEAEWRWMRELNELATGLWDLIR